MNKLRACGFSWLLLFSAVTVTVAVEPAKLPPPVPIKTEEVKDDNLPSLTLPEVVTGNPGDYIRIPATTNGNEVKWVMLTPGLNPFPFDLLKDTKTLVVSSLTSGDFLVLAYTAKGDIPSEPIRAVVRINAPIPPVPPTPPVPPGPVPPGPIPPPPIPPSPVVGPANVLVIYEKDNFNDYPRSSQIILTSTKLREYLTPHVTKDGSGRPDWRFYDQNQPLGTDHPKWTKAMATGVVDASKGTSKPNYPWVVIFDNEGVVRYSGVPGADETKAIELCRGYLEPKVSGGKE